MKRITFLFALFILLQYSNQLYSQEISFYYDQIIGGLSSQSEGDQLIENLTRQIWDETSSSWVNDSLYIHSYNNKNLLDTFIVRKKNTGGVLENAYQETYSYDSNDRLSFSNEWYWSSGYWEEFYRFYYFFSSNNNLLNINRYTWANPGWLYINKYSYNWNSLNDTTRITCEGLYIFYGYWGYFWKDEFSYDSTNLLIMKERFDHYLLSNWKLELRDLYFYDNNRNNTENIRQEWNSTDSVWINDYRYLYEYDLNNVLLSIVYQDWQQDSLNWKNVWRETYTYTPQNQIATMLKETWTQETGWTNYVFRTYFYDANYNWTEKLTQLWDGANWKNYYRHIATWLEPVNVQEINPTLESYHLYNNYPNPFNPTTNIGFRIADFGFVSLKVYDVLGNEVATLVNEERSTGEYVIEFDGKGLPSGIYFYSLRAGTFSETKKMILLK